MKIERVNDEIVIRISEKIQPAVIKNTIGYVKVNSVDPTEQKIQNIFSSSSEAEQALNESTDDFSAIYDKLGDKNISLSEKDNFVKFFKNPPLADIDIKIDRIKDYSRDVEIWNI